MRIQLEIPEPHPVRPEVLPRGVSLVLDEQSVEDLTSVDVEALDGMMGPLATAIVVNLWGPDAGFLERQDRERYRKVVLMFRRATAEALRDCLTEVLKPGGPEMASRDLPPDRPAV